MFNRLKEQCYCGLDIGSQRIKGAVLRIKEGGSPEILATSVSKIYGVKENYVIDLAEFSECIYSIVNNLNKKTETKIKEIQVGLSGQLMEAREINAVIPLAERGSKVITQRDIKKVNDQARLLALKMDEELLHELPQSYKADEVNSTINPLGLYARKLGVHSLMMVTNITRIQNILKAIAQTGYDVGTLSFSSYVASDVTLQEEEKKDGCVLVDIGAKVTMVFIFKDQRLKYISKIDRGGDDLTMSIAEKLGLKFDVAEEIKKTYASALPGQMHMAEEILIKKEMGYVPVKRELIAQATNPFLEQWVRLLRESLKASGLVDQLKSGIVFIGGSSLLNGLLERVSQDIPLPLRLGKIYSLKTTGNPSLISSAVGLAYYGYKKSLRYVLTKEAPSSWRRNLTLKLKELYEDYF